MKKKLFSLTLSVIAAFSALTAYTERLLMPMTILRLA